MTVCSHCGSGVLSTVLDDRERLFLFREYACVADERSVYVRLVLPHGPSRRAGFALYSAAEEFPSARARILD